MTIEDQAAALVAEYRAEAVLEAARQWGKGLAERGDVCIHQIITDLWNAHKDPVAINTVLMEAAILAARQLEQKRCENRAVSVLLLSNAKRELVDAVADAIRNPQEASNA